MFGAMEADLDTQLRARLNACKGEWPDLAKRAAVSYSWLCKFAVGRIDNPGYGTLKRLHAVLVDSPASEERAA